MKKVLIVTYYWPPMGGGGVQRWLKMSKYLHQYGWEPIIYTPENAAFDVKDPSLQKDVREGLRVIRRPIFEPIEVFNSIIKLSGKKAPEQKDFLAQRDSSLFKRFSTWLRGNVFLPDPRVTWVRPSVKYLQKFIKEESIEAVITTGPPHSMHLIGLGLKKRLPGLKWIADFRDPWSEWDLWPLLKTGKRAMNKIRNLERDVLKNASNVVSISPYHVERLKILGAPQCVLVPNGFDEKDFEGITKQSSNKFIIRHMGSVDDLRDPRPFMEAVKNVLAQTDVKTTDWQIEFYGPVNSTFVDEVQNDAVLSTITAFHKAVPHKEVVPLYISSTLLLLVLAHTDIADGNTPGKMYEYMASKTPVLGIGPSKGDAAHILTKTGSGTMIERGDIHTMTEYLFDQYQRWKSGNQMEHQGAPEYSRSFLAGKIAQVLDAC